MTFKDIMAKAHSEFPEQYESLVSKLGTKLLHNHKNWIEVKKKMVIHNID